MSDNNFINFVPLLRLVWMGEALKGSFCAKRGNCIIDNLHFHISTITNISIIIIIIMFL